MEIRRKRQTIKDENHGEYEDTIEWMDEDFEPDYFILEETNSMLA